MPSITVLPVEKSSGSDTLLVVISTVNGSMPDSEVGFFNQNWEPVNGKNFPAPKLKDWLKVNDKRTITEVESELPFMLSTAQFDDDGTTIIFTNRMVEHYPSDELPEVLAKLKAELRYKWNGITFKSAEQ